MNFLQLARQFGTPLYVYDAAEIRRRCRIMRDAFAALKPHIHYSVKANSNRAILRLLHSEGLGFDIVSGGELARLEAAGIPTGDVSFAGVGKTRAELEAALRAGIGFFDVESEPELARLARIAAEAGVVPRVLLRLNPDVDPHTHRHITTGRASTKFGLDFEAAAALCRAFAGDRRLEIAGFHMHLGSQIQRASPYVEAVEKVLPFIEARRAEGLAAEWLDIGGGFGVDYRGEGEGLSLPELATALEGRLRGQGLRLILEPGRWLVARAGVLLMTVQYVKRTPGKTFVVVDAGMHTFLRPALYEGWHKIWPVARPETEGDRLLCDVVGPVCETTDVLGRDRLLPPVQEGDVLALFDAGAYGMTMASTYNSHPRPAEVLVEGETARLIRRRETCADLMALE